MNKTIEKKRLVLIGIRRKGDRGFKIKTVDSSEVSMRNSKSANQALTTSLAS
ncbi:hypothetical protein KKA14_16880 [bacterium]|nr:hypothetical protein [bacterium]